MAPNSDALARALGSLYARVPLGMRLGLDAMNAACARAGHPERAFPVVHVAGTNGKGSTCAMVESIARASGMRTGLYTSPHLCRFAERIRFDGKPIEDDALTALLERALADGPELSFFETATLAAFYAFQEHAVDLAIIEVGIGGRLDATNVVPPPRCAAVTRVAFDHMDKLGTTLDAIAREKAAIAKEGSPIVLGRLAPEAMGAALAVAEARGARVIRVDDRSPRLLAQALASMGLGGSFQRMNAEVAWRIAEELGIDETARTRGLGSAKWPGRFEHLEISDPPDLAGPWILDGAHNPDGAEALASTLSGRDIGAVVFGALADKAWPEMLRALAPIAAPRVYVAPSGRAATDPSLLAARAPGVVAPSVRDALTAARHAAGADPVIVCGSLYLVGEARANLLHLPMDPPVAL
jgi:dihydrofolate synthase / folylpolyglutamate synthase